MYIYLSIKLNHFAVPLKYVNQLYFSLKKRILLGYD